MLTSPPSTQRAIPLIGRRDLDVVQVTFQGVAWRIVKDPVALQHHRLREDHYRVLELLDGKRSLEDIRDVIRKEHPTVYHSLRDLQQLITELHQQELARSMRAGQGTVLLQEATRAWWKKFRQSAMNPLSIQTPGLDPQRLLDALLPYVGWIFHPALMIVCAIFVACGMGWLSVHFDQFQSKLPEFQQFFGWPNVVYMWAVLGGAKILHEFGHGLSCRRYGAECHGMGIMLLVFSPCLYCDVTDSWMLKNKWERIVIGAAGMYVEAILSGIAVILWWNTGDGLLNHLCLNLFFVTTVTTVIFNANPLMRYDGYYMMADFLEIPNLRQKADKLVQDTFGKVCLGIDPQPDPFAPERGHGWFITFAVAAAIYRWVVLFGITLFLCTVLKPYGLQNVGVTAAVISMGGIVFSLGSSVYKQVTAPREEPLSKRRITWSLITLGIVVVLALLIPLPLFVDADFLVQPEKLAPVYVTAPGRLDEILVKPGDAVHEGDVLVRLASPELDDRLREVKSKLAAQAVALKTAQAARDDGETVLSEARVETLNGQLRELEEEMRRLTIRATIDGKVVAAEKARPPALDPSHAQLGQWHGTPLDRSNIGSFLEARTPVLAIAPTSGYEAVLLIDQANRNDVFVGQSASLKLEHLPSRTYRGTIQEIGQREREFAPEGLGFKHGGELPTVTDRSGRERLTSPGYEAIMPLDRDTEFLRTGLRGRARLIVARSPAEWLWRKFRQTFHFRI